MAEKGGDCSNPSADQLEQFNEIFEELERWEAQLRVLPPVLDDRAENEEADACAGLKPCSLKGGPS